MLKIETRVQNLKIPYSKIFNILLDQNKVGLMSISFVSSNMDVFIELFIMLHKFNVYLNPWVLG